MENLNVSFKSKICFVDRNTYNRLRKINRIGYWHDTSNILKADEFYSEGIKTCTGGGILNSQQEAEGFHFWDDKINKKNFNNIVSSLFRYIKNPERALLIGSKDLEDSPYSIEQFERFKKVLKERIKNVTLFERHNFMNSQSHYHYDTKTDTWTIFSEYRKNPQGNYLQVTTLKRLKECFKNISISNGDHLFLNGKEISLQQAPEIFEIAKS